MTTTTTGWRDDLEAVPAFETVIAVGTVPGISGQHYAFVVRLRHGGEFWICPPGFLERFEPTHWQPLPFSAPDGGAAA